MGRIGRLGISMLILIGAFLVTEVLYILVFGRLPSQLVEIALNVTAVWLVFFLASVFNTWRARKLLAGRNA